MATYNGERHLLTQLQSLSAQTLRPDEIIVSDDGSTDGTLAIAEQFGSATDITVTIIRQEARLGYADNFLAAASMSRSRYIAFCDQDDVWQPAKLERCVTALDRSGSLLAVHAVSVMDADGAYVGEDRQGIDADRVWSALEMGPWPKFYGFSMVFDRRLLSACDSSQRGRDNHDPTKPLAHDRWVCFLASSLGSVVTVPDVLASYRQHGQQLFGSTTRQRRGIGVRVRRMRHYRNSMSNLRDELALRAELASNRARLLSSVDAGHDLAPSASKAAAQWTAWAQYFLWRRSVLSQGSFLVRSRLLLSGVLNGRYRQVGCSTRRHLLQDLVAAVFVRTGA